MWKQWILIFVGGGLGSLLRFALGQLINPTTNGFPWATFTANLLGCFLFGLLGGWLLHSGTLKTEGTLLLLVGFCGGLTTFSTFMNDNYQLINAQSFTSLLLYSLASLLLGMLFLFLGFWLTKTRF